MLIAKAGIVKYLEFEKNLSNCLQMDWYKILLNKYCSQGMEWNGNFGMEYGRCQNGMEDFKNGIEDILPYQFHTRFRT